MLVHCFVELIIVGNDVRMAKMSGFRCQYDKMPCNGVNKGREVPD
jgi:hypothetical protein